MEIGRNPIQSTESVEIRYRNAATRLKESGRIERMYECHYAPKIERAKRSNEDHTVITLANCAGDTFTASPEKQAYIDAVEKCIYLKGYKIEEQTEYVQPDGTTEGNRTYLRLKITFGC